MEDRKGWRSRGAVEITLIVRVVLSRQGGEESVSLGRSFGLGGVR